MKKFKNPQESHEHSLQVLEQFYEHDDFMESVGRVMDLGCGYDALDLQWWATRTTRDEEQRPLNIQCVGVDLQEKLCDAAKKLGISYQRQDLELMDHAKKGYDVLWCHDVFQYITTPLQTLGRWWNVAATDGMLVLSVPQATNIEFTQQAFDQQSGCYYNHTVVSLIHMLAVNGWDCAGGFFQKRADDPWIHAIVYKSQHQPMDPRTTTWYELAEKNLLPESAVQSLQKYGFVRQRDLVLPWLDKSLSWLGQQ